MASTRLVLRGGVLTPLCECGATKIETTVEEIETGIALTELPRDPETERFRLAYLEHSLSPEVQERINRGEILTGHSDSATATRKPE